jgi:hypothetical protein
VISLDWGRGLTPDGRDLPPLIPGRLDYRLFIDAGQVVAFYAVEAQLARDGPSNW